MHITKLSLEHLAAPGATTAQLQQTIQTTDRSLQNVHRFELQRPFAHQHIQVHILKFLFVVNANKWVAAPPPLKLLTEVNFLPQSSLVLRVCCDMSSLIQWWTLQTKYTLEQVLALEEAINVTRTWKDNVNVISTMSSSHILSQRLLWTNRRKPHTNDLGHQRYEQSPGACSGDVSE